MTELEKWELYRPQRLWLSQFLDWAALHQGCEFLKRDHDSAEWINIRLSQSIHGDPLERVLAAYWNIDYDKLLEQQDEQLEGAVRKACGALKQSEQ